MTETGIEIEKVRHLVDTLAQTDPPDRIEILRDEVMRHGGRWDLPGTMGDYHPALVSVSIHGVYAMAEDVDELAANWCRAARNILCDAGETFALEPGAEVLFRRSPSHVSEPGIVTEVFGGAAIEVVDLDAKRLRLEPGSYEIAARESGEAS